MALGREKIFEEIENGRIRISSADRNKPFNREEQVKTSSIDLHLQIEQPVTIPPRQVISLKSREIISLPKDISGNIVPRRSWMERGIFVGSGFIQPGEMQQLDIFVSNLTDSPITLSPDDSIYQIILEEIKAPVRKEEKPNLLFIIKDWASLLEYSISKRKDVEKPPAYPEVLCLQGKYWEYLQQGKEKGLIWFVFSKIFDFFWRLPTFLILWWIFWGSQSRLLSLKGILFLIIALLLYRGSWILLEVFKNWADGVWRNHIHPKQKFSPSRAPSPQLRTEWLPATGFNLFWLLAFIIFIAYMELLFWYMAFFTIVGKGLKEVFTIFKAPIDVIFLPMTLLIYGDKNVFGFAISLAFILEFWILYTFNFVQHGVESYEKSQKNEEQERSAVSLLRIGFLLAFPAVLIEYAVMAIFAWRGGHQFNFPLWLTYLLTIAFPIGEIMMTRGTETRFWLLGKKQTPKKYWGNIWKGIRLIFRRTK